VGLGANVELVATGNDLTNDTGESYTPVSGVPTGNSVLFGNKGIDNTPGPTYASAGTVTITLASRRIHLTGTTTVNTITPAWNGQELCIVSDDGVVNFGTAGNIGAAAATSGIGGMVCGYYDNFYSKWRLK
jgi:hypothetical protein